MLDDCRFGRKGLDLDFPCAVDIDRKSEGTFLTKVRMTLLRRDAERWSSAMVLRDTRRLEYQEFPAFNALANGEYVVCQRVRKTC
jgi:hypothetical protein